MLKMTISTSICGAQHPNAGLNIQHPMYLLNSNTPNIIELIRIGPRWGLNPQPQDCGAPTLPTLPSGSVFISLMYAVHPKSNDLMFEFEKNFQFFFAKT